MEQLLLQAFLAFHELDVVEQQHVEFAVAPLERRRRVGADRFDELRQEGLGGDVPHAVLGQRGLEEVHDGLQQVRLAKAGAAVDEQGVVGHAGGLGHCQRCCLCEPVAAAGDEALEGVARVGDVDAGDSAGRVAGRG